MNTNINNSISSNANKSINLQAISHYRKKRSTGQQNLPNLTLRQPSASLRETRNTKVLLMNMNPKRSNDVIQVIAKKVSEICKKQHSCLTYSDKALAIANGSKAINEHQLAAIEHIFEVCNSAYEKGKTSIRTKNGEKRTVISIRKNILKKISSSKWFKELAVKNVRFGSQINDLIERFTKLENRLKADKELQRLVHLSEKILSPLEKQISDLKAQNLIRSEKLKKLEKEYSNEGNDKSTATNTTLVEPKVKLLRKNKVIRNTIDLRNIDLKKQGLLRSIETLKNKIDNTNKSIEKKQKIILKKQLLLKMHPHATKKALQQHRSTTVQTLLHSYLSIMSTEELIQYIGSNIRGLRKFVTDSSQKNQPLLHLANKQYARLIEFCSELLKSDLYVSEISPDILVDLAKICGRGRESKDKTVAGNCEELKTHIFEICDNTNLTEETSSTTSESMSDEVKSTYNDRFAKLINDYTPKMITRLDGTAPIESHLVLEKILKEMESHFIQLFENLSLKDFLKDGLAVDRIASATNAITDSIKAKLYDLAKNEPKNFVFALMLYSFALSKSIDSKNFHLAQAIFSCIGLYQNKLVNFMSDLSKKDPMRNIIEKVIQKIEHYNTTFLTTEQGSLEKSRDNATLMERTNECLKNQVPFIPPYGHFALKFKQLETLNSYDDNQINVHKLHVIEKLHKQWIGVRKNLVQM